MHTSPDQLGFDGLLRQTDEANRQRRLDLESAHLPREIGEAIRLHRKQIKAHHAAIQALDLAAAEKVDREAHLMAVRVNNGDGGILAHKNAPGYVLSRRCAAAAGKVPLFGQAGRFTIDVAGVAIQIDMAGMFGLSRPLPGFDARAIDHARPFISETGYRSFLASYVPLTPGLTTAEFAERAIAAHIAGDLKGKLRPIHPRYRPA